MRLIVLALLLALAFGTAQAVPLQGSDGNATVVLFGATRTPLADENSTQEILKVDVGLIGAENATYELVDADDNIYQPGLYKPLSSGKQTGLLPHAQRQPLQAHQCYACGTESPFTSTGGRHPKAAMTI